VELALHAYVKARGDARAVLPPIRERRAAKKAQPIAAGAAGATNTGGPTLPANQTTATNPPNPTSEAEGCTRAPEAHR